MVLEHRPAVTVETDAATYAERIKAKTDQEIVAGFLEFVRNGVGPTAFETELVAEVLAEQGAREVPHMPLFVFGLRPSRSWVEASSAAVRLTDSF